MKEKLFVFTSLFIPPPSSLRCSSGSKELLHDVAAFFFEHARGDLHSMVQGTRVADAKLSFDCAEAFVARSVNEPPDSGLHERPRTHRARLNGRVNNRVRQTEITKLARR